MDEKEKHETRVHEIRRGHGTVAYKGRCSCGWKTGPEESAAFADAKCGTHKYMESAQ